ncbi:hypothetical protein FD50_GL000715 [Liquorilactobacillus satsumensis DSM 16230 = JCM 12392]|uniref:Uncharacterized protein n=1 Tax=Liquorilactobacillus satsumensis DSM 16230 = JCM 12392 TaxID=1423801 RepID=A0A0R1V7C4_9LACO|nr:hypothetical protein FD50_GL000715 [Liquorilactobacillus satsumensis DSM 16230 = JCM 12392]
MNSTAAGYKTLNQRIELLKKQERKIRKDLTQQKNYLEKIQNKIQTLEKQKNCK